MDESRPCTDSSPSTVIEDDLSLYLAEPDEQDLCELENELSVNWDFVLVKCSYNDSQELIDYLVTRVTRGDKRASKLLFSIYQGEVHQAARKLFEKDSYQNWLDQQGNRGLTLAIERFNRRMDVEFHTYAIWWIRQAIAQAIIHILKSNQVDPLNIRLIREITYSETGLQRSLKRSPTDAELSLEVGIAEVFVREIRQIIADKPIFETSTDRSCREADPRDLLLMAIFGFPVAANVEQILSRLTNREQEIVELRFGIVNGQMNTLSQVGQKLGISLERVRQIELRAMKKLRHIGQELTAQGFIASPSPK